MPLEAASDITALNATNPTTSDPVSEGAAHLRLLKSVLKTTFPNFSGPMTVGHATLNALPGKMTAVEADRIHKDGSITFTATQSFGAFPPTCTADPVGTNSLTRRSYVDAAVLAAATAALQAAYPVGALWFNANVNTNPATFLGFGTWAAFGTGRMLLSAGTGNDGTSSRSFTRGNEGGLYKVALAVGELPAHTHTYNDVNDTDDEAGTTRRRMESGNEYGTKTRETASTGSGTAHENLPPYVAVNIWRRTA